MKPKTKCTICDTCDFRPVMCDKCLVNKAYVEGKKSRIEYSSNEETKLLCSANYNYREGFLQGKYEMLKDVRVNLSKARDLKQALAMLELFDV